MYTDTHASQTYLHKHSNIPVQPMIHTTNSTYLLAWDAQTLVMLAHHLILTVRGTIIMPLSLSLFVCLSVTLSLSLSTGPIFLSFFLWRHHYFEKFKHEAGINFPTPKSALEPVWPDLVKFWHFGKKLSFWPFLVSIKHLAKNKLSLAKILFYLATFHNCKWPNVESIILPSGHTASNVATSAFIFGIVQRLRNYLPN